MPDNYYKPIQVYKIHPKKTNYDRVLYIQGTYYIHIVSKENDNTEG